MSLRQGDRVGNYEIVSRIGVGGMGSVYLAQHHLLGKQVALKIIHRDLATNEAIVARFFNEAKALNSIGNQHIVEVMDFGQTDTGEHFFIMEYLVGKTLADVLENGALPVELALHVTAQIANGLSAAHDAGLLHRDLKPDNVMLITERGDSNFVKVLDFGLAKAFRSQEAQNLTATGVLMGTPQYMSPEACQSKPRIDHRADIYSLGVLFYQMVTGHLPFQSESTGAILVMHVDEPPPAPRAINPAIPPAVEQIVLRCLAKSPDARFQSMTDLRSACLDAEKYMQSAPPVMPATQAAGQATVMAEVPAQVQAVASVAGADARTAFMEAPPVSNGAPVANPAADQPTMMAAGGMEDIVRRANEQMPQWAPQPNTVDKTLGSRPTPPAVVSNRTMAIATPPGFKNPKRTRRAFMLAIGAGILLGSAILLLISRSSSEQSANTGSGQSVALAPADASVADAAIQMYKLTVETTPEGATVINADTEEILATTPGVISRRPGVVRLLIQHPETEDRTKTVNLKRDMQLSIELLRKKQRSSSSSAVSRSSKRRSSRSRSSKSSSSTVSSSTGVMNPFD